MKGKFGQECNFPDYTYQVRMVGWAKVFKEILKAFKSLKVPKMNLL
jgi:hypothetical protein